MSVWETGTQYSSDSQSVRSKSEKQKTHQRNIHNQISLASAATQRPLITDLSFPLSSLEITGEQASKMLILSQGHGVEPMGTKSHTPWSCGQQSA